MANDISSSKAAGNDTCCNCPDCLKEVSEDQPGLVCDGCDMWYHAACGKVSDAVYEFVSNNCEEESVCWFCKRCEIMFRRLPTKVNL